MIRFSTAKPLVNCDFFLRLLNYFFTESFSFLFEKTVIKFLGHVNELSSLVVINLDNSCPHKANLNRKTYMCFK